MEQLQTDYSQLKSQHAQLQHRYEMLEQAFRVGSDGQDKIRIVSARRFVQRLTDIVAELHVRDLYSDITICCRDGIMRGHRFILAARSKCWSKEDLSTLEWIDLDVPLTVAQLLFQWAYTDELDQNIGYSLLLKLYGAAIKYGFDELRQRCGPMLVSRLDLDNCLRIYQFGEHHGLERLCHPCEKLVNDRWAEFRPAHFSNPDLAPAFLVKVLRRRTNTDLLMTIIGLLQREDVLSFHLSEEAGADPAGIQRSLNEKTNGKLPLELAFEIGRLELAHRLIEHGASLNSESERNLRPIMTSNYSCRHPIRLCFENVSGGGPRKIPVVQRAVRPANVVPDRRQPAASRTARFVERAQLLINRRDFAANRKRLEVCRESHEGRIITALNHQDVPSAGEFAWAHLAIGLDQVAKKRNWFTDECDTHDKSRRTY